MKYKDIFECIFFGMYAVDNRMESVHFICNVGMRSDAICSYLFTIHISTGCLRYLFDLIFYMANDMV